MVTWNGYKLTQAQAQEVSGIQNVFWLDDFEAKIRPAINYAQNIYLSLLSILILNFSFFVFNVFVM
jgi:Xaa-Pro aminopeptidase